MPSIPIGEVLQTEPATTQAPPASRSILHWWQAVVLVGLLLWLYLPTLSRLVAEWFNDPNFSHGSLVPIFCAFVIWLDRSRLSRLQPHPSWWGALLMGFGLCVLVVGQLGAELFLSRSSLLIVLAALIVLLLGWNFFRALLFPWAFLFFAIPIPAIIFNQ